MQTLVGMNASYISVLHTERAPIGCYILLSKELGRKIKGVVAVNPPVDCIVSCEIVTVIVVEMVTTYLTLCPSMSLSNHFQTHTYLYQFDLGVDLRRFWELQYFNRLTLGNRTLPFAGLKAYQRSKNTTTLDSLYSRFSVLAPKEF